MVPNWDPSVLCFQAYALVITSSWWQVIVRARNLRASANFIPSKSFRARKLYYSNEQRMNV
ncbi:hypothetical protein HS088_TW21G01021 [Tripterygium wilfordii]|uniref:Uncharacterized protein n=1 Tax=Tripterygium wilfordii TaxID=458696 RepID=A0A7J7C4V0_TRIWF|nr:hypothetical protein HS088_TW21G01021 [Tripterygium wilfordii]